MLGIIFVLALVKFKFAIKQSPHKIPMSTTHVRNRHHKLTPEIRLWFLARLSHKFGSGFACTRFWHILEHHSIRSQKMVTEMMIYHLSLVTVYFFIYCNHNFQQSYNTFSHVFSAPEISSQARYRMRNQLQKLQPDFQSQFVLLVSVTYWP